jgi:hypothetical protein
MKFTASDRSSLIRLASNLPVGSAERRAILAGLTKLSKAKAIEPYRSVEAFPSKQAKPDKIKDVKTDKQLRDFVKLLNSAEVKMTPALEKKLTSYGVGPQAMADIISGRGFALYVTDAGGREYDAYADLGLPTR